MSPSKFYNYVLVSLPFILLFVSLSFNLSHSQSLPDLCHPYDKKVLLRIKNKLGNPSSLASWQPKSDCCTEWNSIQCNEQGHVTTFDLPEGTDIRGPIPPFLDELPSLEKLFFRNVPNLSGPIPSYIGKLTNLTVLIISRTNVGGPIPSFFSKFTKLIQLDLSYNKFSGPIPDFVGRFKHLVYLELTSNRLTGPVPTALAQLSGLSYLSLSSNHLSGPMPGFLGKLKNLNALYLDSNSLSGPIPRSLGNHPNITTLTLSHNKLTGDASFLFGKANTVPVDIRIDDNLLKFDFTNVYLGRNLWGFNVSHNMIYGALPTRFGLMRVDSVDVSYNQLCGSIPNGRRFKRVDPIIFAHNKCLCGGPLRACK